MNLFRLTLATCLCVSGAGASFCDAMSDRAAENLRTAMMRMVPADQMETLVACVLDNATEAEIATIAETSDRAALDQVMKPIVSRPELRKCASDAQKQRPPSPMLIGRASVVVGMHAANMFDRYSPAKFDCVAKNSTHAQIEELVYAETVPELRANLALLLAKTPVKSCLDGLKDTTSSGGD